MSLGEIIEMLEAEDPRKILPMGFRTPHSYRGDYMDLAFVPEPNVSVGDALEAARSTLGAAFPGYKGGVFQMSEWTRCWLAEFGATSNDMLGPMLMGCLLAAARFPGE